MTSKENVIKVSNTIEQQKFESESNSPSGQTHQTHQPYPWYHYHLVATSQPRSDGPSEVWMGRRYEVTHKDKTRSYDDGTEAKTRAETEKKKGSLSSEKC